MDFSKALSLSMNEILKRIPKNQISASDAFKVVNTRTEYSFTGKVFASEGTEWTIIYSNEQGLSKACYQRTVFVKPVPTIDTILNFVEKKNHQTIGLLIKEEEADEFVTKVTEKGIERITEIGKMSNYDHPWDGMFPLNQFVRWSSSQI
jgi:hypothetical protein